MKPASRALIEGANHNNIFSVGRPEYLKALRELMATLG